MVCWRTQSYRLSNSFGECFELNSTTSFCMHLSSTACSHQINWVWKASKTNKAQISRWTLTGFLVYAIRWCMRIIRLWAKCIALRKLRRISIEWRTFGNPDFWRLASSFFLHVFSSAIQTWIATTTVGNWFLFYFLFVLWIMVDDIKRFGLLCSTIDAICGNWSEFGSIFFIRVAVRAIWNKKKNVFLEKNSLLLSLMV